VGLAAARARGRAGGRKPKLDTRQIKEIKQLMSDPSIPVSHIAERYQVSRTTIYKVAPPAAAQEAEPQPDASRKQPTRQDAP
jgi:DNA invertase Pin-like site-specific DNA recombinase